MIINTDFKTGMEHYLKDIMNNRVSSPTNEMCHKFNIECRKHMGFVLPLEVGDILCCNRTSQIWPILNGDRVIIESLGEDFKISILLPGNTTKTEVWLKYITVRSLESDKVFTPLVSMDYLLGTRPSLSKNIVRALVANHKMTHKKSDDVADYLNPFLNPALLRYGYSQTGHKLQGSECESIVLIVKSLEALKGSDFGRRYAYTTITRARKSVVVVELPWF